MFKISAMGLFMIFAAVAAKPQFNGLDQLVGQCWQATFSDGVKVDTHCFSEVYQGAFIKDQHVVCGGKEPYYGETWYVYDTDKKTITYRYYNSLGGISDGSIQFKDNQLIFPDETYQQGEKRTTYRTTWSLGEQQYQTKMSQQDTTVAGGWKPIWEMTFKAISVATDNTVSFDQTQQLRCQN